MAAAGARASKAQPKTPEPIVQVNNLKMYFPVTQGIVIQRTIGLIKAVDDISFDIFRGETLGLVGESGCGKTTTGRCILQLTKATEGKIFFEGQNLNDLNAEQLRRARTKIQVIFQDPYSSLNPRMSIGEIIGEAPQVHKVQPDKDTNEKRTKELLSLVGLPTNVFTRFPHELSGGQRQRVGIARALVLEPRYVVAD